MVPIGDAAGAFRRAHGRAASVWLIRPDHYIGCRADRLRTKKLVAYARRTFGPS
jgi:hypothetical protein